MEEVYKLKELKKKLMKGLEDYASKEMTASSLDIVMKMSSAVKNLAKVIKMCEEEEGGEYSSRGSYASYASYDGEMEPGRESYRGSYARGRRGASRDSRGRYSGEMGYSRHGDPAEMLREVMEQAPDEQTRRELERIMQKMER